MATAAVRSTSARLAANKRWSEQDPVEGTAAARRGFWKKFEDQVDPNRVLPEPERRIRAERAMKAHMAELRLIRLRRKSSRPSPQPTPPPGPAPAPSPPGPREGP